MKTMLDVIRDTKAVITSREDGKWEVKMHDKEEVFVGELGFKVLNPDWTCRNMQYAPGNNYEESGKPVLCEHGMHYCPVAANCFNYYYFDSENKVALVLAYGEIDKGDDKHCTNKLLIVREIPWIELLEIANQGKNNTGLSNTGDYNTGDYNIGHRNIGHRNTGDRNTGDYNTGHRNTGHRNTGNGNLSSRCTGDYNIVDNCSGVFCSEKQTIKIFDRNSDMTIEEWRNSKACELLSFVPPASEWRSYTITSHEEDREHPECEKNGGYFRIDQGGQRFINWWEKLDSSERQVICSIPNFDAMKFKKITGIDVNDGTKHTRCYEVKKEA